MTKEIITKLAHIANELEKLQDSQDVKYDAYVLSKQFDAFMDSVNSGSKYSF